MKLEEYGKWVRPDDTKEIHIINPTTQEVIENLQLRITRRTNLRNIIGRNHMKIHMVQSHTTKLSTTLSQIVNKRAKHFDMEGPVFSKDQNRALCIIKKVRAESLA